MKCHFQSPPHLIRMRWDQADTSKSAATTKALYTWTVNSRGQVNGRNRRHHFAPHRGHQTADRYLVGGQHKFRRSTSSELPSEEKVTPLVGLLCPARQESSFGRSQSLHNHSTLASTSAEIRLLRHHIDQRKSRPIHLHGRLRQTTPPPPTHHMMNASITTTQHLHRSLSPSKTSYTTLTRFVQGQFMTS